MQMKVYTASSLMREQGQIQRLTPGQYWIQVHMSKPSDGEIDLLDQLQTI